LKLYFAGAIAAGNAVVFKPSEIAHHTATVLSKLIPEYLDKVLNLYVDNMDKLESKIRLWNFLVLGMLPSRLCRWT